MSRNPLRFVVLVLLAVLLLTAAPLQANPSRIAANGTPSLSFEAFLSGLWERAARLLGGSGPVEKEGVTIDPDGATSPAPSPSPTDEGASIDPNGRP